MNEFENIYEVKMKANYYCDTGYCKTKNKAISKVPFDEINDFLDREDIIRDIKGEIDDLIDTAEGIINNSKIEVFKNGIYVYKDKSKGWKIEIYI